MTLWQRTDGSLLGTDVRGKRDELAEYLQYHCVPAVLELYPDSDDMVGIAILADPDGRAAFVRDGSLASGLEIEDLAADIAERFDLTVVLGEVSVEMFDEGIEFEDMEEGAEGGAGVRAGAGAGTPAEAAEGADGAEGAGDGAGADAPHEGRIGPGGLDPDDPIRSIRAVTITSAGEEYFPALARSLGEPVTTASAGTREVVLTTVGETPPGTFGWEESALPIVQLVAGEDRSVIAFSDESSTARTWGTERMFVTGAADPTPALTAQLAPLDSDDDDARVIASVSPTADLEAVAAALRAPAAEGPALLLEALGIGADFADFLEGTVSAEEMPGARMWEPATAAQMFRAAIDDVIDDAADLKMVEMASDFDARWPAISRTLSIAKAAAGSGLIVAAVRSTRAWRGAGALTGAVLVLDAMADVALFEWLRRRREGR